MQYAYDLRSISGYPTSYQQSSEYAERSRETIKCKWSMLRAQLLLQWQRVSAKEIDIAGPNRQRIALLIQGKYGIDSELVENYLRNFERTLPVM